MDDQSPSRSEIELGVFLNAIWRRRWGIATGTIAAMLAAAVAFLLMPAQYEATARLAISGFHLKESVTGDDGRETFEAVVSTRMTYASLAESPTTAKRVVEKYGLDESLDMTPVKLLRELDIRLIPNTALLEMTLELPEPQTVMDVVLTFAEETVELSRQVNDADRRRVKGVLETQLGEADAELDRLEAEIAALKTPPDEGSTVLRRLESEFGTALAIRSDIAQRLKNSEITVASQIAELVIVDRPTLPERPSSFGFLAVLAAATSTGLIVSVMVAGMLAGMEATRD